MGKLVVTEFISLDGVIDSPGGGDHPQAGWTFKFDLGDGYLFKNEELVRSDAQLLGRVTYEGFAAAWPTMEGTGEFGVKMNTMPKVVVSTTLESPEWENSTVIRGNLEQEVPALKERYAGDILLAGSAQLAQSLFALDLVDELNLIVFPIVLGSGKKLFADGAETKSLTPIEYRPTGQVVIARYGLR